MTTMKTTMKMCTACHVYLALSEFALRQESKDGRHTQCKVCIAAVTRTRRAEDPNYANGQATTRARHRAMRALAKAHPDEFGKLLTTERVAEGLSPIPWKRQP